eukprot:TRINITY_DN10754_c0_g4_i1.p1 TRINITY_DN10754_c0_g4~~TRINITY_DN10754_c0_g4_i1.p1  ORF type:complete len:665 (+),score=66.80 TRINITY_DN10754_c0_g4_i1:213-2207(+)
MRQLDKAVSRAFDCCDSPTTPQSFEVRLKKQSRLFGDLGKHLLALSQLVEQELNTLPPSPEQPCHATKARLETVLQTTANCSVKHNVKNVGATDAVVDPLRRAGCCSEFSLPHLPNEPGENEKQIGVGRDHSVILDPLGMHRQVSSRTSPRTSHLDITSDTSDDESYCTVVEHCTGESVFVNGCGSSWAVRNNKTVVDNVIKALQIKRSHTPFDDNQSSFRIFVGSVLDNGKFEAVLAAIVISNSLLVGLQTEEAIRGPERSVVYTVMDVLFTLVFSVELFFRIYYERLRFLSWNRSSFGWNLLDCIVIANSILESGLAISRVEQTLVKVSVLRMLRVFRLARLLRTVKLLRYFRDLRVMLLGIFCSMKSLTWAGVLLCSLMYLNSVLIVDTLSMHPHALSNQVMEMYGGVGRASYTLFLSILGGVDWGDAAAPLFATSAPLGFAFTVYVTFSIMCVLNIVTGVFVENASRMTAKTYEEVIVERLQSRQRYMDEACSLISSLFSTNRIDEHDFVDLLGEIEFHAILRKLDVLLAQDNARDLFRILDFDGEGLIDVRELMTRIEQFHGQARSIDILRLSHVTSRLQSKVDVMLSTHGQNERFIRQSHRGDALDAPTSTPTSRRGRIKRTGKTISCQRQNAGHGDTDSDEVAIQEKTRFSDDTLIE